MDSQGSLPTSDAEIGMALKQLRGRRSLRDLAKKAAIGKSSLDRYETGATPIPLGLAKSLDKAYEADGWIEAVVAAVGRGRWEPWRDEKPKRTFAHRWPAKYQGLVWIIVRPVATNIRKSHDLQLW